MTYLSSTEAAKRAITANVAADNLAAILTDIDSVINTCLEVTSNVADAQTLATILPIAKRMLRMEIAMQMAERNVDATASIALSTQLAALGIGDPIQLTNKERAMLKDAYSSAEMTAATAKKRVAGVYSTLTGDAIYQ
jgi:hypothetical protein